MRASFMGFTIDEDMQANVNINSQMLFVLRVEPSVEYSLPLKETKPSMGILLSVNDVTFEGENKTHR